MRFVPIKTEDHLDLRRSIASGTGWFRDVGCDQPDPGLTAETRSGVCAKLAELTAAMADILEMQMPTLPR